MRIAVVVFEGFDELDAIGPLEVLRNAATMGDALTASLPGGKRAIHGAVLPMNHPAFLSQL